MAHARISRHLPRGAAAPAARPPDDDRGASPASPPTGPTIARRIRRLILPGPELARLDRLARRGYPYEVCGLLLGRVEATVVRVVEALEAKNVAPERRHDRYVLDPAAWLFAEERSRRAGLDIVGVWHTHPDHPARPSATDLAAAWPDFSYLIVSVTASGVTDRTAWRLAGYAFVEQPVEESRS